MPARKIQDEGEVLRWFEEGRTYDWMVEEYKRKYNIETVPSLWGNFRRRRGLPRRIVRDDDLIPWLIKEEHRWLYPLAMLRVEARKRAGAEVSDLEEKRLQSWREMLAEEDAVVHYDPDTEDGFFYIPRQPGDDDIIHKPARKTTPRRRAD
ncbi:transcriptional repressor [Streptomyces phage Werner]|uniref:Immunity repressor n=1 Tax=Streptomyces phage Werner TaxID=2801898 RepID=A0A7U0J683_9CAUD|nr:transcriptional repressor [Streptomyces phage Werner]QAY17710.1 immunity repressor [Streptomyces phage Asten]QFP95195.1 immunity repressor [Streptomyces phage Whatever]QQO39643.1 immunity repressor [Streptomyces phage Hippo]QQO39950.1 immunity repressor [Streptomyces phage Dwayne]QYW07212.1 immunity repressor [Streptomyces phage Chucky]QYW07947.1 immunity repressor [Streptomyces phage Triste]UKH48530.1 immunity repressor [Streptomyces phage Snorlax]WAB09810.1 immunity repressor [Streptom